MKKLLILLLLVPSLSWGEILNVKFPFKLFCEKNHYGEIYYKILHGVSNNEFYFYEVSSKQSEYQKRVKTKLELEILNKDLIGLTENLGLDYKRILFLNIFRRDLSIQFETSTLITQNFECKKININIHPDLFLKEKYTKDLEDYMKENKI